MVIEDYSNEMTVNKRKNDEENGARQKETNMKGRTRVNRWKNLKSTGRMGSIEN